MVFLHLSAYIHLLHQKNTDVGKKVPHASIENCLAISERMVRLYIILVVFYALPPLVKAVIVVNKGVKTHEVVDILITSCYEPDRVMHEDEPVHSDVSVLVGCSQDASVVVDDLP